MKTEDIALVQKAIDLISEHFDTVQVFATRHEHGEKGGTIRIQLGTGNWFARYGHVKAWVIIEDEAIRVGSDDRKEEEL